MKLLLAHEHYRSGAPSGEDGVYNNERQLLESMGVEVIPFEYFNDHLDDSTLSGKVRIALEASWSRPSYKKLGELLDRTRPDIAHFHNTFPAMSPSVYAACQARGIPVVQTLHNYRLICPGALLMREGRPCESCVGKLPLTALRYRCYRDSLPATAAAVLMLASNRARGNYQHLVDRYIALTEFGKSRFVAGGLPENRITIKPNFLPNPPSPGTGKGNYAVYVGRLSAEKGIRTLVKAWRQVKELSLIVVGDGMLMEELRAQVQTDDSNVQFVGRKNQSEVMDYIGKAVVQIIPSECYEGFPLTLLEAYACGTPVLASRSGALAEIVKVGYTGLTFTPGDASDLTIKLSELLSNQDRLSAMRKAARAEFDAHYTPECGWRNLQQIYGELLPAGWDKQLR